MRVMDQERSQGAGSQKSATSSVPRRFGKPQIGGSLGSFKAAVKNDLKADDGNLPGPAPAVARVRSGADVGDLCVTEIVKLSGSPWRRSIVRFLHSSRVESFFVFLLIADVICVFF